MAASTVLALPAAVMCTRLTVPWQTGMALSTALPWHPQRHLPGRVTLQELTVTHFAGYPGQRVPAGGRFIARCVTTQATVRLNLSQLNLERGTGRGRRMGRSGPGVVLGRVAAAATERAAKAGLIGRAARICPIPRHPCRWANQRNQQRASGRQSGRPADKPVTVPPHRNTYHTGTGARPR